MSLKAKLGLGVASAVVGLSLIGGGTYAYFSDQEVSQNTFASGTLDLSMNPTTIVKADNLKPGDYMIKSFKLDNKGTLDIKKILLETSYKVMDKDNNNGSEDFGKHIRVDFLYNQDKDNDVIYSTTLADLAKTTPDAIKKGLSGEKSGIKAGTSDDMFVMFTFVDNDQDQNMFQGDGLELTWKFNAQQGEGERK
ncbi:Secreted and spore coat-associated protein 1, biofilm matrix component TasA like protein [Fictibacillus macauensis ZFHKF-1]|uniref:Secreted and spore coat-associated protein 1, biofilm matrix component TasA like protein n=1 Tax=Fictibacillus macauensis ZFHKF-1 TaxID=1196324 RepID=I8UFN2_9BACL|nr:TasA family protein [Fictibacillus macauensis]EIT85623.1 Secreted and spore coat-associated protein 1, biofilm matrix component TasA like protein [Fictibacillus macauensis ZFHKF-1]